MSMVAGAQPALFGERLAAFNLLPSLTLHPSRDAEYGAPPPGDAPAALSSAWHRHRSALILQRLDLAERPVLEARQPELALALLAPEPLAACARMLGATLCGARLRRAIAGTEVRHYLASLGEPVLRFARVHAPRLHAGTLADGAGDPAQTARAVLDTGHAALLQALSGGGPELALRAGLKLPADAGGDAAIRLQASAGAVPGVASLPCSADQALSLALDILKITEPTWHSSFPAIA